MDVLEKISDIRSRLTSRRAGAIKEDDVYDYDWITINHSHVPLDKEGKLGGTVGEKIPSGKKESGGGISPATGNNPEFKPKKQEPEITYHQGNTKNKGKKAPGSGLEKFVSPKKSPLFGPKGKASSGSQSFQMQYKPKKQASPKKEKYNKANLFKDKEFNTVEDPLLYNKIHTEKKGK